MLVYTAITGNYDSIKEQPVKDAPFLLVRPVSSTVMGARRTKILAHHMFSAEYSMWIDGSMMLHSPCSLRALIDEHLDGVDIAVMRHPERDCIYEEGAACASLGKGDPISITRTMLYYKDVGMPAHWGLSENGMVLRRNTKEVRRFCEEWFSDLVMSNTGRDQLAFTYTAWRLGFPFKMIPERFFTVAGHNVEKRKRAR